MSLRKVLAPPTSEYCAWDPYGTHVAYVSGTLRILDVRKGTVRVLERGGVTPESTVLGLDWSRDGSSLAFSVPGAGKASAGAYDPDQPYLRDHGRRKDLWSVRLDGKSLRKVGTGSQPRYLPDGSGLAALDRLHDRFGLGLRWYGATNPQPSPKWLLKGCLAFVPAPDSKGMLVQLESGDLVLTDRGGRVQRVFVTMKELLRDVRLDDGEPGGPILPRPIWGYLDW